MSQGYVQLNLTGKQIAPNNKMYTVRKKNKSTWVYNQIPQLIGQENKRKWKSSHSYFIPNMEAFTPDTSKATKTASSGKYRIVDTSNATKTASSGKYRIVDTSRKSHKNRRTRRNGSKN